MSSHGTSTRVSRLAVATLCAVIGGAAGAQDPSPEFREAERECNQATLGALQETQATLARPEVGAGPEERQRYYERLFDETPVPPACRRAQDLLFAHQVSRNSNDLARSFDASASSPTSQSLVERAGVVQSVALALRSGNFVSADDTAVTLNLNAASAFCNSRPCQWERLGGSLTFGARIPEKDVVGFSGFPDPGQLFEVFVWDVKLRLFGDRNPAGARWRQERDRMARDGWLQLTRVRQELFPATLSPEQLAQELHLVQAALNARARPAYDALQRRIGSSWLVSAKFSGQHLTEQPGRNKYAGSLLLEGALGKANLTLNATYSAVNDVPAEGGAVFSLKTWQLAAGLSGDFMAGALVPNHSSEWSLAGRLLLPADDADVPVDRERVYQATLELRFPMSETAHVPVSVTYTNDPNSLTKQRFVRGQIGVNYDFGALKKALTGGR